MGYQIVLTFAATLNLPIFTLLVFFKGPFCLASPYEDCVSKHCGDGIYIIFPFYIEGIQESYCGFPSFKLNCNNDGSSVLQLSGNNYIVENISYYSGSGSMRLVNEPIITCLSAVTNLTLDPKMFQIDHSSQKLVFLMNCSKDLPEYLTRYRIESCDTVINQLVMLSNDTNLVIGKEVCNHVVVAPVEVPVIEKHSLVVDGGNYAEVLKRGFTLYWVGPGGCYVCEQSGGRCGYDETTLSQFVCFCPHSSDTLSCPSDTGANEVPLVNGKNPETLDNTFIKKPTNHVDKKRTILVTALTIGVVMILVVIILCLIRKLKQRIKTKTHLNEEIFLQNNEFLARKRYTYSQLKKMTNSFEVKLGQGGFSSVYKGSLSNGNLVAVKVLSELKGNGEDFINEVASVGHTSHVNIVSLVGFCLEGSRRALIYEFMPNGSLERFIYDRASTSNSHLGWESLHQIAIGVARGLEYLHRGCNSRILHFDIKPHNILLDQDFCPKISDFGLAKLFPKKASMISMSHSRGTPGYIAPGLFSKNFGKVSHKSDVYSYGMMILEMVGGRKNIEVEVDHTSEIYFPHWIYKKIESDEKQIGLQEIVSDEENEMVRKMIIVGLWCIQTNPLSRPTITKVLEMLEADLASLEIPPKPYLTCSSRSPSRD